MFLFEDGCKAIGASVARYLKSQRFVDGCILVTKYKNGQGSEFSEECVDHLLHFCSGAKGAGFF